MKKSLIVLSLLLMFLMSSCKCKHDWGEWQAESEKSCETDYVEKRICTKCNEVETKVVREKGHNYNDVYFKRNNGHYQKCQDCGKISEIEPHIQSDPSSTGSIICTKCNYLIEVGDLGFYQNIVYSLDDPFTLEIENLTIKAESELDGEFEIRLDNIKSYFEIVDEEFIGYLTGDIKISEMKNQIVVRTIDVNGDVVINEDNLYIIGNVKTPNSIEEYVGGKYYMNAKIQELIYNETNMYPEDIMSIYQTLLEGQKFIDYISEESLKKVFDAFFVITNNKDSYELEFTYEYIKEFINNAFEKNIKNLINHYFGKYTFGDLLIDVELLLDTKIGLLISKLESIFNITVEELFIELDNIAKEITGQEDATFEDLISINIDLEELLTSEEFKSRTIIQLIAEEENETEEKMMEEIISGLEELGNLYLYQLLGYNDPDKELLLSEINKVIELIENGFSFKIITNIEGIVERVDFNIDINIEDRHQNVDLSGEIVFNSNVEEFDYNKIITEVDNFFNNINYGEFFIEDEDQEISFEKDEKGNVTTVIISDKTYANTYSSDYILLSTDVRKYTYYFDLSLIEDGKVAYLNCDNWVYVTFPGEFKVERARTTVTYHYDENGNLLNTTETEPTITFDSKFNFRFAYNMVSNELIYDNDIVGHMHEFELKEVIEPDTNNCDDIRTYVYECKNCHEQVKEYELIGHSSTYRNESEFLNGKNCSDGVIVKSYCKNCNELIEESNHYYHKKYLVDYYTYSVEDCKYDEKEHGVQIWECACGEYKELNCINMSFSEYRIDENNQPYNAYYCHGCDFVVRIYSVMETNEANCSTTYYNTYKLYNKDTFLVEFKKTNIVYEHDLVHYSRLKEGSVSCTDGVENYWECRNCGYIDMGVITYSHSYQTRRFSLAEYGCKCENGYYERFACACGEIDYGIEDVHVDSRECVGSQYNVETSTRRTKYICTDCNFRYVMIEVGYDRYYEVNCDENFENGEIIK